MRHQRQPESQDQDHFRTARAESGDGACATSCETDVSELEQAAIVKQRNIERFMILPFLGEWR
jgi:hypothetical protein